MFSGKRALDTTIVNIVASLPVALLLERSLFKENTFAEFIFLHLFAAIFCVLNIYLLRRHILSVRSVRRYLLINVCLWAVWTALAFLCLLEFDETFYLWLYYPAKIYEQYGAAPIVSLSIYSVAYLAVIIAAPLKLYRIIPWSGRMGEYSDGGYSGY